MAEERGVKELIAKTWKQIDQAEERLADPNLSENDKIRWAGVLANLIGTLNRLLWKAGMGKVDKEDLASILSKIPEKYVKIVKKGIVSMRGRPSQRLHSSTLKPRAIYSLQVAGTKFTIWHPSRTLLPVLPNFRW